jgi:hypothetical protein
MGLQRRAEKAGIGRGAQFSCANPVLRFSVAAAQQL